jgi:hypothetical protein
MRTDENREKMLSLIADWKASGFSIRANTALKLLLHNI